MRIITHEYPELKPLLDAIGIPIKDSMRVVITIAPGQLCTVDVQMILRETAVKEISKLVKSFALVEVTKP